MLEENLAAATRGHAAYAASAEITLSSEVARLRSILQHIRRS